MQVSIDGQPVLLAARSLRIGWRSDGCSTAAFRVIDQPAAATYHRGQTVEIRDDDNAVIFRGPVDASTYTQPKERIHSVQARCWQWLADKRIVAHSWVGVTAGQIARDIADDWLSDEGVTHGIIQDGPEIPEAVANYRPASEVLDRIAEAAGMVWFIDAVRRLHLMRRGELVAPWTLTRPDMVRQSASLEDANPQYRNRQYITGVLAVTDPQTESWRGDGDARVVPLRYEIATVPTVEVSRSGGQWVEESVGIDGLEGGRQWYWSKGNSHISQDPEEPVLTTADRVRVTYRGQFDSVVITEDAHQVAVRQAIEAGSGLVEDVERADSELSLDAALQLGAAKLREYARESRRLKFRTWRPGLRPGMLLPVDLPLYGITDALLIETVSVVDDGPDIIWYDVTATLGAPRRSWTSFFVELAGQSARLDSIHVGEGRSVTIAVLSTGRWTWSESHDVEVFACPVPSATTYPANGLYPC